MFMHSLTTRSVVMFYLPLRSLFNDKKIPQVRKWPSTTNQNTQTKARASILRRVIIAFQCRAEEYYTQLLKGTMATKFL